MDFELWTDGACVPNPGSGGWAAVLVARDGLQIRNQRILSGAEPDTTNNRMELTAVIEGLLALSRPTTIRVFSDSRYVVDSVVKGWLRGWMAAGLEGRTNADLWTALALGLSVHDVSFTWVPGHVGINLNELADRHAMEMVGRHAKAA